jgi:flavin-dependent thymidylate synthase
MSSEVVKWGDDAQYVSEPIKKKDGRIVPQAFMLWGTPDPLGAVAAVGRMFKGIPTYDLADITDDERRLYWEETFKSHLRAPHEFIQLHFFVEGVSRSHTHQMVRQRTATFAQESLRFAVKEDLANEIPLPPSIAEGSGAAKVWTDMMFEMEQAYTKLVNSGVPAEDARGLLPHATTTRLHWRTNLNDLLHHAGNRLCTQAQFEWRILMISVMKAMREYGVKSYKHNRTVGEGQQVYYQTSFEQWQWELIAQPTPQTFAPICYHTGKCEFRAIFDRPCSIRDRVDAFAAHGIPSDMWGDENINWEEPMAAIRYEEWLMNPDAAR